MCVHCTRRQFIGSTALSGIALASGHLVAQDDAVATAATAPKKVRICAIIAGPDEDRSWSLPKDMDSHHAASGGGREELGQRRVYRGQRHQAQQAVVLLAKAGPDVPVLAISADISACRGDADGFQARSSCGSLPRTGPRRA